MIELPQMHPLRASVLFTALIFAACGGGGSSQPPRSALPNAEVRAQLAATPAATPGFTPIAAAYVLLEPVSGGPRSPGRLAAPPKNGFALVFAAQGNFLRALTEPTRLPPDTAYELDVLTTTAPGGTGGPSRGAAQTKIEEAGWTLVGGPQPLGGGFTAQPFAVHLASVAELQPRATIPFLATTPSFFVWNSSGMLLGAFNAPGRFPGAFTVPEGSPVTVMDTTASWPESHCGNCWLVLQH